MPIPHNRYRMLLIEQIIEEECSELFLVEAANPSRVATDEE
jgi:hypothetical protein